MAAEDNVKVFPLLRAEWLLSPPLVEKPRARQTLIVAAAFALSGLGLGFIMLMGIGYNSKDVVPGQNRHIQSAGVGPSRLKDGRSEEADIVDAIPLKDEDGQPLQSR